MLHGKQGPPFIPADCHGANCGNMGSLPELNAIIAVFSTGPVGVGDARGASDASIVLPSCDAAGAFQDHP